ncbi:hypothetical protein BN9982_2290002 [Mycobacterium tuberculosis]|nr:hypothetical protein BN9982_2290002 [Mycobacterium tuberculosis]
MLPFLASVRAGRTAWRLVHRSPGGSSPGRSRFVAALPESRHILDEWQLRFSLKDAAISAVVAPAQRWLGVRPCRSC